MSVVLGLTVKVNGTAVSNNVCQCDVKLGYWEPNKELDRTGCLFVKCDRGFELTEEGWWRQLTITMTLE